MRHCAPNNAILGWAACLTATTGVAHTCSRKWVGRPTNDTAASEHAPTCLPSAGWEKPSGYVRLQQVPAGTWTTHYVPAQTNGSSKAFVLLDPGNPELPAQSDGSTAFVLLGPGPTDTPPATGAAPAPAAEAAAAPAAAATGSPVPAGQPRTSAAAEATGSATAAGTGGRPLLFLSYRPPVGLDANLPAGLRGNVLIHRFRGESRWAGAVARRMPS